MPRRFSRLAPVRSPIRTHVDRFVRRAMLAALLCLCAPAAFADVYGYVDPDGTLHLATERLDERYTLFLKSGDAGRPARVVRGDEVPATTDQALMKTRLFQRLVNHPNIVKYDAAIRAAAARHGLDPQLVKAVIAVESGFEPGAVSEKGAVGLMQILPGTGERYGVRADRRKTVEAKLADPLLNLEIGTRYLADLEKLFVDRPELVLAAYNAGENAVLRNRAIPPYPETVAYVKLVDQFHAFYGPAPKAKPKSVADEVARIRVTIAARRNLPDPDVPLRLPAPAADVAPAAASIEVPASPARVDDPVSVR